MTKGLKQTMKAGKGFWGVKESREKAEGRVYK